MAVVVPCLSLSEGPWKTMVAVRYSTLSPDYVGWRAFVWEVRTAGGKLMMHVS